MLIVNIFGFSTLTTSSLALIWSAKKVLHGIMDFKNHAASVHNCFLLPGHRCLPVDSARRRIGSGQPVYLTRGLGDL